MTENNIVGFRSKQDATKESLIAILDNAKSRIEAGDIQSIVVAGLGKDPDDHYFELGFKFDDYLPMLGLLSFMVSNWSSMSDEE
jgi:hypothetical protein